MNQEMKQEETRQAFVPGQRQPITPSKTALIMFEKLHSGNAKEVAEFKNWIFPQMQSLVEGYIHKNYSSYYRLNDDLVQESYCAIWKEIMDYDPTRGALSTWMTLRIKHAASEVLRRYHFPIGTSTTDIKVRKAKNKFMDENDREPTALELSMITGMKPSTIQRSLDSISQRQMTDVDEAVVISELGNPEKEFADKQEQEFLIKIITKNLSKAERQVLCSMRGIMGFPVLSMSQLSEKMDIPVMTVEMLYDSAMEKLKNCKDVQDAKGYAQLDKETMVPFEDEETIIPFGAAESIMDALDDENEDRSINF